MKRIFPRLIAWVVMALVGSMGAVQSAGQSAQVDVTGAWAFSVESAAGKSNPSVTFKQEGEKLTGQYSSQLMGETTLTGTIKGRAIEFTVSGNVQGTTVGLKYTGTVDGKDSIKGTISAGEFGDGTFTAMRK